MPAAPSSLVPADLAKLGPFHQHDTGCLRVHLRGVPDPRSRRGRWYPLVGLLLICACAVVSGARTITEITEWGQRATTTVLEQLGIRRHLPGRRRAPSHATFTRPLSTAMPWTPRSAPTWPDTTTPTAPALRRGRRSRWTARRCPAPRTGSSATGTCCPPSPTPPPSPRPSARWGPRPTRRPPSVRCRNHSI
ncbi:transposase family protein [Streptomyces sp. NPDC015184]|uniref:transposase family protein n=1 Tax=Streptomyces sp. NPDC015184 TaxID=3364946 RepID=UPI0036FFCD91